LEPANKEDLAVQAPHHCGEIIHLIDELLGDLSAGHAASPPAGVGSLAEEPQVETHVGADSSIVCRPSGGLDTQAN
jgi:hypothetical protein